MMTLGTFERLLAALDAQAEKDRRNGQLMRQVFPEACGMWYDNTLPDGQSWTDNFIYELDYGRKNDDLKAYRSDGCEIPLSTPADLYRYLAAEKARREMEGFIDRHKAQGDLSEVVERFNEM